MHELDEMKLARVIVAAGKMDGRIKMQKIVFLLKKMGYDLPFDDFSIRQQGPYSRAVACATDVLLGGEILEEEVVQLGRDEWGQQVSQYNYTVRDGMECLIRQHFDIRVPEGKPDLDVIVRELKAQERAALEVAATRLYLEGEVGPENKSEVDKEINSLKGHLRGYFDKAADLIEDWKKRSLFCEI